MGLPTRPGRATLPVFHRFSLRSATRLLAVALTCAAIGASLGFVLQGQADDQAPPGQALADLRERACRTGRKVGFCI